MLELFHWEPVGHSARVLICLNEIGVKFESRYVDLLDFEQYSADFLAMNPFGLVPVLRDGDATMTESALINEFLVESHPDAGLAPEKPLGWYQTQAWSKYVDYNLGTSLATIGCRKYLVPLLRERAELRKKIAAIPVPERMHGWQLAADDAYNDEMIANSERKLGLVIERMEKTLADAEWLVGDRYSIADIDTFALMRSLRDLAPNIINDDTAERTLEWIDRISARPAVEETLKKYGKHEPGTMFVPGPEHSRWG